MKKEKSKLEVMNPDAAGIDVASSVHYVCVPEGRDEQRFRNLAASLKTFII